MTYQPEWDIDREYGEYGEDTVRRFLALDKSRIETKRKRIPDDIFYVETHQSPLLGGFRPSGINTTAAEYYIYVIADTGVMVAIPVPLLKAAALNANRADERDGSNPTRGRLVRFRDLFVSNAGEQAA